MNLAWSQCVIVLSFLSQCFGEADDLSSKDGKSNAQNLDRRKEKLSQLSKDILVVLDHFKQPDPVGIPNAPIPDPLPIPTLKHNKGFPTVTFKNSNIYGLSKFRIELLESNLSDLQIDVALNYAKLEILGNYTLSTWFSKSNGGYNVTIEDVFLEGVVTLKVAIEGNLEATEIEMDLTFNNIEMDFQNVGILGNAVQGIMNTGGSFIFDSIKPLIFKEVNTNIRGDINKKLKTFKEKFPNSLPPIDVVIAELRKIVKENKFDPLLLENYNTTFGLMSLDVLDIEVTGLASFYRYGNLNLTVTNNTLFVSASISTEQLVGKCEWEIWVAGLYSRFGRASFTVDYVRVDTKLHQSLDIRNRPKLEKLKINIGNIQLRFTGLKTLDYLFEFLVNIFPNLLRNQILRACESLFITRIQDALDGLDLERLVEVSLASNDEKQASDTSKASSDNQESSTADWDWDTIYDDLSNQESDS